jgi:hypothetical protein
VEESVSVVYEGLRDSGQSQLRQGRGFRACLKPVEIGNLRTIKKFKLPFVGDKKFVFIAGIFCRNHFPSPP